MFLVPGQVGLALQRLPGGGLAQHHVDDGPAYLHAGRCRVHHFGTGHTAGRQRAKQLSHLRGIERGDLSVDDKRDGLGAQREPSVRLGHAGQQLQGGVGIVHRALLHQPGHVVDQPRAVDAHHRALAPHHHLWQTTHHTVHA